MKEQIALPLIHLAMSALMSVPAIMAATIAFDVASDGTARSLFIESALCFVICYASMSISGALIRLWFK